MGIRYKVTRKAESGKKMTSLDLLLQLHWIVHIMYHSFRCTIISGHTLYSIDRALCIYYTDDCSDISVKPFCSKVLVTLSPTVSLVVFWWHIPFCLPSHTFYNIRHSFLCLFFIFVSSFFHFFFKECVDSDRHNYIIREKTLSAQRNSTTSKALKIN